MIDTVDGNTKAIILSGSGSARLKPNDFVNPRHRKHSRRKQYHAQITSSKGLEGMLYITVLEYRALTFIWIVACMPIPALNFKAQAEDGKHSWTGDLYVYDESKTLIDAQFMCMKNWIVNETGILIR